MNGKSFCSPTGLWFLNWAMWGALLQLAWNIAVMVALAIHRALLSLQAV